MAEARWPDPGGDERAAVSLPPAEGRYFGANDDFEGDRGQQVLATVSRAGANAVRRTLSWWHGEPVQNTWFEPSWADAQRFHETALANGMTPIHVLGFAPPWARKSGARDCVVVGRCEFPPRREMIAEWSEFAAEAARRFPGAIFEVWNEANLREFWQPRPNPELWAELVVTAYDAIKAVAPDATVIACGCAGVVDGSRAPLAIPVAKFLRRAYDHGVSIAGHFDGISVHLFPQTSVLEGGVRRALHFGSGSMFAALVGGIRDTAAGYGERWPIWITEAGYWTRSKAHPRTELSRATVAAALSRLVRKALTTEDIRALIIHRAQDTSRHDRSELRIRESTFGLLGRGDTMTPKPSFCVFAGLGGDHGLPGCAGMTGPALKLLRMPHRPVSPGVRAFFYAEGPAETGSIQCSVDGSKFIACGPSWIARLYRSGRHVLRVRGLDSAGRSGVTSAVDVRVRTRGPRGRPRCTITGTRGDDVLRGTRGRDVICGRGGDDVIYGGGGGDLLIGAGGNDKLRGAGGSDKLIGGRGNDHLLGGGGADLLLGGSGSDRALGGRGSDRVVGGAGNDYVVGGRDADLVSGGPGRDRGKPERYTDTGIFIRPR